MTPIAPPRFRRYGTPGPDVIASRGGNDIIHGQRGDDLICAGGGDNQIYAAHTPL
jgi:hypothetical protein